MRNLKKILALVLALVMSLSLVTIANAADFKDSDEIDYEEAVAVMSAIGVIEGMDDGNFDPDGILTREQAAKLITYMLMGENAEKLGIESSTFKDVAVTRWSAPAIEYCATLGIIDGAGDGNFYPAGQLTGYAFAKMLLTAIGYDSKIEGFTGAGWSINVATVAMEVGLDDGLEGGITSANLTRQEAAQMCLNAIKTPLVTYDKQASITVNGAEVNIGAAEAKYVTTTLAKEQRISKQTLTNSNEYTVEFGEKYFTGLRLLNDTDDFDRPSHTWSYNTDEIGTYVDYETLVETYTTGVTGKNLYDLLGSSTIKEYDVYYYVDGHENTNIKASNMIRTNTVKYAETGNGVLTQVFVDHDKEEITITSINTFLAKAQSDYNEKKGTLSLTVYNVVGGTPKTVSVDDFAGIADYKEGDYVLVNWAETNALNNYEVAKITDPDVMTDKKVTKYSDPKYLVTDSEQYDYSLNGKYLNELAYYANALSNFTYNVYLDQYGYVAGTVQYSGQLNYLFLTGYDMNSSNLSIKTATAGAIFLDGSMSEIQVNVTDTNDNLDNNPNGTSSTPANAYYPLMASGTFNGMAQYNRWFTYTTSEKDGKTVYTLNAPEYWNIVDSVAGTTSSKINTRSVRLVGTDTAKSTASGIAYGNDDSVYITVDTGSVRDGAASGITKVNGTYTGVQNVDIEVYADSNNVLSPLGAGSHTYSPAIFSVYNSKNYVIGAVVVGKDANQSNNYAYAVAGTQNEWIADGYTYWEFKAVVDGKIETLTVKENSNILRTRINSAVAIDATRQNALFKLTYDADGYVVDAVKCVDDTTPATYTDEVYGNNEVNNNIPYADNHKVVDIDLPTQVTLVEAGNTLYLNNAGTPISQGLTIAPDATIVVVQKDTLGNNLIEEYSSFAQALTALEDIDDNVLNGVQFVGRVSAVLNTNSTAKYVVLKSATALKVVGDDGSVPDGSLSVLNLTFNTSSKEFTSTIGTKEAFGTCNYTITVYQGDFVVATKSVTGAAGTAANTTFSLSTNAGSVISASGNYTVKVSITDTVTGKVLSGENTFTL